MFPLSSPIEQLNKKPKSHFCLAPPASRLQPTADQPSIGPPPLSSAAATPLRLSCLLHSKSPIRVVQLILTLPVSTATTERGFSAMKIIKNRLRNKMSDEYLANSLLINIEKEIAEKFDHDCIIDEFKDLKRSLG
ncbi:hypothetical protein SSX86_013482 [Deinandra increscens subsp. villosa]|uniref:HAT C-terminal dimerisation domain-containing protein n=1 Tax=Deinandra increscens subsp. villosa TaxID=3103831 RepID=A0AAP0D025_9ASTR